MSFLWWFLHLLPFFFYGVLIRKAAQPLTTGKTVDKWEQTIDDVREH